MNLVPRLLSISLLYCGGFLFMAGMLGCSHVNKRAELGEERMPEYLSAADDKSEAPQVATSAEFSSEIAEFNHYNDSVKMWENYFTGRGRKLMRRYLERSGRYLPFMKKMLREEGLPEDLVYVAMIESGFSPTATSHASAVGYWQFIRGTGKRYGLEISYHIDERRDPIKATRAAAKYLKALHTVFGSWQLAMASYNTGENRVKRAMMKHYTRDFWQLSKKKALPRETRNYVPKFLAALRISTNPQAYGFHDIAYQEPFSYEEIRVQHQVNLRKMARKLGLSNKQIRAYNPEVKTDLVPTRRGVAILRVPVGMSSEGRLAARESRWTKRDVAYSGQTYTVRRGDTLSHIAQRTGTRISQLRSWNGLGRRSMIRVGQKLRVSSAVKPKTIAKSTRTSSNGKLRSAGKKTQKIHIVRRGETLSTIARKYSVTLTQLTQANRIQNKSRIFTGSHLIIPD